MKRNCLLINTTEDGQNIVVSHPVEIVENIFFPILKDVQKVRNFVFMGKFILLLVALFALVGIKQAQAQDFPWPDLGDPVVIEPGEPGVINNTINAATKATHFVLKRGVTYIYTGEMKNAGFPIMVTAENAVGDLPIIRALGPAPGAEEATRPFLAQGDLFLKDIRLSGWDLGDNYTDNATVRFAADGITIVIKDCIFDFNRQNAIRINAKDCNLYVENTIFGNQGIAQRLFQGFAVTTRGNWVTLMHLRNNTFYNLHHEILNNMAPLRYGKFIFENNTVVNTGTGGFTFGKPDTVIFKNNLHLNIGILGDGIQGDRSNFVLPIYYLSLDSNIVDGALVKPHIDFKNNHFYLDPEVAAALPDSSNKSSLTMFHPMLEELMGEKNEVKDQNISFTNFLATTDEYKNYINTFYSFAADPWQMPQFGTDVSSLDFSYSSSLAAYSAATDGGPLGDRNWFPNWTDYKTVGSISMQLYPNPVANELTIKSDENISRLVINSISGRKVAEIDQLSQKTITIPVNHLNRGIYFVSLSGEKGLSKMIKFIKN
jgi:hypothetical protein